MELQQYEEQDNKNAMSNRSQDIRRNYMSKLIMKRFIEPDILQQLKQKEQGSEIIEKIQRKDAFIIKFMEKSNQEIRNNYIQKLISNKILKLDPQKKYQTIIIFDWDDTLFSTTFLAQYGFYQIDQQILESLIPLDQITASLIQKSSCYGDIYIVTNAAEGWVEHSGSTFLPKLNQILQQCKVKIISARSNYELKYPGNCNAWKQEAFQALRNNYDNIPTNIIVIGDSMIEINAAHSLGQKFNQAFVKTIKFKSNPRPEEIVKQCELVLDKFEQIFMNQKNLTIKLEKKQSQRTTSQEPQEEKINQNNNSL